MEREGGVVKQWAVETLGFLLVGWCWIRSTRSLFGSLSHHNKSLQHIQESFSANLSVLLEPFDRKVFNRTLPARKETSYRHGSLLSELGSRWKKFRVLFAATSVMLYLLFRILG